MNSTGNHQWKRYIHLGTPPLLCFIIAICQYYFRRFDTSFFTSWRTMFFTAGPQGYFFALLPSLIVASFAFKISLPARMRSPFLFVISFAAAAFYWIIPEGNVDTSRYFTQAKHLKLHGVHYFIQEWGKTIPAWTDLPVVPFLDGLLFTFFGESRIYVQALNTFFFSMTVILTSLIGKKLWDEKTGFYAGALLLGMPFLIITTPLMLVDVPMMFFLTLSVYVFIHAVEDGGKWRIAAAVSAITVAVFTKYSTLPMLSVLPLISIIVFMENDGTYRQQIVQRTLGILLITTLLVGSVTVLKFDLIMDQIKLLRNIQLPGMYKWTESYTSTFLFQLHPIIAMAAIASLLVAALKRDIKYVVIAWLPFLIMLFQVKRIRYLLPAFPMLALMASYGLGIFRESDVRKTIVASVITASLVAGLFVYLPYLKRSSDNNLKQAGAFLDTLDIDAVEVFTMPQQRYPINPAVAVPILDLFTRKKVIYRYISDSSTPDKAHRARFSWAYRNPAYYTDIADNSSEKKAILLILGRPRDKVPSELMDAIGQYNHAASFLIYNPQFIYQTNVRVFW